MTFYIEKDEGTAARRRVPFRLFTSDGTSPDTGASNDTLMLSISGAAQIASAGSASAISAAAGMYYTELSQSNVSVLGSIAVWYDLGDFDQHVANVQVVNSNPMSSQSNIPLVATVTDVTNQVTADATAISGDATAANNLEAAFDGTGYSSTLTVLGVANYLNDPRITLTGTSSEGSITGLVLTGGSGTTAFYDGQLVALTGGTGVGQARTILDYRGDNNLATVTREFATAPDGTSEFVVSAADIPAILEAGNAQGGAAGSITLDAQASAVNSTYVDEWVMITAGTGIGQTRVIGVYNGTTKVATVSPNWTTTPDATSVYQIIPAGRVDVAAWAGNAVTATGGDPDVNVQAISGDVTAADNLEATFDGTGYDSSLTVFIKDSIATIAGDTNTATLIGALNDIDGTSVTPADGSITAAKFGVGAIDAAALATDAVNEIADGALDRDMSTGADSGSSAVRTMRDALRTLRNRVVSDATQIYVYQEDDATIQWTASLVTVASTNNHISGMDPNS